MGTADRGFRGLARKGAGGSSDSGQLLHEATTHAILGGFFRVYNELGAGFVEGVYARALAIELEARGLHVECEVPVSVYFRGVEVGRFRADLIVDCQVLVELKAAEALVAAHEQQVINYLSATSLEVALLLNFGPKASFKRLVLTNTHKTYRWYPRWFSGPRPRVSAVCS